MQNPTYTIPYVDNQVLVERLLRIEYLHQQYIERMEALDKALEALCKEEGANDE